ncbi:MAG: N-formylglutamate amidohydrolase [Hyphomicrobiaceae bacterium]|nr:N-formylglutamate amidohydrolase [Hyphomicrobiaceae bacterium]MCC0010417.1 N-formylglutamate amidohydrolase [Hyphomicrobiaceae bacterium]
MQKRHSREAGARIAALQAPSHRILAGRADAGLIIVCDHAENTLPPDYGTLGLPTEQLERHIAYDIGAKAVTEHLSAILDVPAILTRFSRLLIDPNRGFDDPTLIMRLSDGAVIPGNRVLSQDERRKRIETWYRPYHRAVDALIDEAREYHPHPVLLSIHSFTEVWRGDIRPWQVGVLWDADDRVAGPLIDTLVAEGDLLVGDNEPYSGKLQGDCMWVHGTQRGLPHALIEVRQDLIREEKGQREWAQRLASIMRKIANRRGLAMVLGGEVGANAADPLVAEHCEMTDKTETSRSA